MYTFSKLCIFFPERFQQKFSYSLPFPSLDSTVSITLNFHREYPIIVVYPHVLDTDFTPQSMIRVFYTVCIQSPSTPHEGIYHSQFYLCCLTPHYLQNQAYFGLELQLHMLIHIVSTYFMSILPDLIPEVVGLILNSYRCVGI
jgi:hypothetical protein